LGEGKCAVIRCFATSAAKAVPVPIGMGVSALDRL
jgi:hypothetical protein